MRPKLILSLDLEWFYSRAREESNRATPLPKLIDDFLRFARDESLLFTIFCVGEVARRYPSMVKTLGDEGHELACHGDRHLPIANMTYDEFVSDVRANIDSVFKASGVLPIGFRAPLFSVAPNQYWVYEALEELGIRYSSSVLSARNPLYSWPGFGQEPRRVGSVVEFPVTLSKFGCRLVPLFGGSYLRACPQFVLKRRLLSSDPNGIIQSYVHPYDYDTSHKFEVHAELLSKCYLAPLLFLRRSSTFKKLSLLSKMSGCRALYKDTYSLYL